MLAPKWKTPQVDLGGFSTPQVDLGGFETPQVYLGGFRGGFGDSQVDLAPNWT